MISNRFRWVFCQLEVLRHCFPNNLRRTLEELPKSLDDTYKRILKEINNANQVHAYRLIQCLAVASRPLRVDELAEVLAFDLSEGGIPKLNADWRWENQEEAVLLACSSLVSVVIDHGSQVVQFSHFSVKEFLTSDRLARCTEESQFYIPVEPSHTILAQACLGALLSLDHHTDQYNAWQFPLYGYATTYWVGHALIGDVELVIKDSLDHFFDMDKPYFSAWFQREFTWELSTDPVKDDAGVPPSAASLYFAAWRGFRGLVERLAIKHPQQVDHLGGRFGTPLYASLQEEHFEVAQLLLAHGADINSRCARDFTPLHFASEIGHLKIVKWLLNHGADVNSQAAHGQTPLYLSTIGRHLDTCRMLLEHGAAADTWVNAGTSPFLEACRFGPTDIIMLLLDYSPDVNVRHPDHRDDTPLHWAARRGFLEFAQKLLELGAEVNLFNSHDYSPLLLASQYGHSGVVRLLLDYNAHWYVNAHDENGDTSLHKSVGHGHFEVVRMLLAYGAGVNTPNNLGFTPLHRAARYWTPSTQALDIVRLLLNYDADVQARNSSGKTPSEEAFDEGHHEIVQLLSHHAAG